MTVTAAAITIALVLVPGLSPAQESADGAGSISDVTGVWTMLVEGHQIGLELEQKGEKVEGVMLTMGRRVLLVGDYVERKLTLKGERPEAGVGLLHATEAGKDAPGPIVATMKDDGTLEGELSTTRGRTKWTGERLKKR